jgi:hypothetical protein
MANLDRGIDLWESMANTLNQIVLDTGKIERDNPTIWQGYLHQWNNEEWEDIFYAVNTVKSIHPDAFTDFNERKLVEATAVFKRAKMLHLRCMDRKSTKTYAWSTIMLMREVWNTIHQQHIPFTDTKKKPKKPIEVTSDDEKTVITIFHQLFTVT